jgi:acyl-CoA thioester hydrolase
MRSLGRPVLELQNADCIFPVIEARLCYKTPARYDDLLTIEVWVTAIEKVRLNFGHRVLNQDGKLILEAETFHVCTSREEKPKRLLEELVEKLKPFLNAAVGR